MAMDLTQTIVFIVLFFAILLRRVLLIHFFASADGRTLLPQPLQSHFDDANVQNIFNMAMFLISFPTIFFFHAVID